MKPYGKNGKPRTCTASALNTGAEAVENAIKITLFIVAPLALLIGVKYGLGADVRHSYHPLIIDKFRGFEKNWWLPCSIA